MLTNATSFAAQDVPYVDPLGHELVVIVVKGTFVLTRPGHFAAADEPSPVRLSDVPFDPENPRSSLRYPSDMCPQKLGTDVVVVGEAVSPQPVSSLDIALQVRDKPVALRVHGERCFYRSLSGLAIGPALKFERKPLVFEKAYGGASEDWSVVELRNPSGLGVAKRESDLIDTLAPQIEHPARPHRSARDKHPPVGFCAIPMHWSPRREYAGTFDELWQATRMPLLPKDYDPRFFNVAHPDLQMAQPLCTGDRIGILGMTPELFQFEIPSFPVLIRGLFDKAGPVTIRPAIDTVLIEPTQGKLELTCRHAFRLGRGHNVLREVRVDSDARG